MAGTASFFIPTMNSTTSTGPGAYSFDPTSAQYVNKNGFDLIWRQRKLQEQMGAIEEDIRAIEENANLSDTEKMFSMQMAMNSWSAISNLRTNMLKTVADTLKSIARNVA